MTVETASPAQLPGDRPPPLLLSDVRTDMAAIFGRSPAVPSDEPRANARRFRSLRRGPTSASRRIASRAPIAFAALAAGLLLGVAIDGRLALPGGSGSDATMEHAAPATEVAENPFEGARPAPAQPADDALLAVSDPPTTRPEPAAAAAPAKRIAQAAASRPRRPAADPPRRCGGDRLEQAWCMRPDILKADRRLRRAYAEAIHQGVERRFLIDHQRRWARLRNRAARDPSGVLEGYDELADALERLSVNGRAANRI